MCGRASPPTRLKPRNAFARQPGTGAYQQLIDFAQQADLDPEEQQAWAIATARDHAARLGDGSALVAISLLLDDLDLAWKAAREHGAGMQWQTLAAASATHRPLDAARLYQAQIDGDLQAGADTRRYPTVARHLTLVRDLHRRAGQPGDFDRYLAHIRDTYRRRPSLMAALDRAGL